MKLIIAGTRTLYISTELLESLRIHFGLRPSEIVCGMASGVDKAGARLAEKNIYKLKCYIPDWNKHGRAAGPIRNGEMAEYADKLLLIWDGKSKGSANMKLEMEKLNKPIYEVIIK